MTALFRITLLTTLFLVLAQVGHAAAATAHELPELGDSSSTSLTPAQSRLIGSEIVRRMRNAGIVIDDPLVSRYIEEVGRSLAVHTSSTQNYTFFVVDAPSINAFALPGGYIGIHSGLILASQTESELASVVAHEIAHVSQHHLARGVEQANRMELPLTIAVLATILLSGGDPNVASAAMAAGLGGSAQMQLNFTRAHEHEADRVGMQLLASSEYDPQGMAAFFTRLQEQSRYYGEGVPEFLSTHPVTTARLAEAQSAAERYPRKMRVDTTDYQVAKARVRLHHHKSPTLLMRQLNEQNASPQHSSNHDNDSYLRAITHIALQQPDKAEKLLRRLVSNNPASLAFRETLGQHLFQQGKYQQAITLYREGLARYPHNELLILSLSTNLLASRDFSDVREQLQGLLRRNPQSTAGYHLLAQLESETGHQAAAHLALAEYYLLLEEPHSALEQLTLAKRIDKLDFYHASRIEALDKDITSTLEEQHRLGKE